MSLAYAYFSNGQIQEITNSLNNLQTEKYTYDELHRLLTAQRGPDGNIQRKYSYDYDRYGNRWGQTVVAGSGLSTQLSFNSANNHATSSGFSYDNSSNLTANATGLSFTYDLENFLSTATGSISYKVDAQGRRVRKTVGGTITDFFYTGAVVISEKQGSNWTDYIFFGNQRIAKQTGSTASTATYLHVDHLGSTHVCTDSSGNANGTCFYEPFGEIQPGSSCSVSTNYRFAGMEFDSETGLYHTWFRQYDPSQGRWMSVDPLPGTEDNPQSQDRYTYVLNDPVNLIDPLGLTHCWEQCGYVREERDVWVCDAVTEGPRGPIPVNCHWVTVWEWVSRCRRECGPGRHGGSRGPGGNGPQLPPSPPRPAPDLLTLAPQLQPTSGDCLVNAQQERNRRLTGRFGSPEVGSAQLIFRMAWGTGFGAWRGSVWARRAPTVFLGVSRIAASALGGAVVAGAVSLSFDAYAIWQIERDFEKAVQDCFRNP